MGRASRSKWDRLTGPASTVYDRVAARERHIQAHYPDALAFMEHVHETRVAGDNMVPHPPEVWGPAVSLAYDAVRRRGDPYGRHLTAEEDEQAVLIAATAPWRYGRSIYLFDPWLAAELFRGDPVDVLPTEVLYRLSEWSMYLSFTNEPTAGSYAALEWEATSGRPLLGLTMEHSFTHYTIDRLNIFLDTPTISASNEALYELHRSQGKPDEYVDGLSTSVDVLARLGAHFLPLVAYLCSENADVRRRDSPRASSPALRWPRQARADRPSVWGVGWRIGPALRRVRAESDAAATGTHASPRPHLRRAPFHSFWTGQRDGERRLVLRWLHPMLVATKDVGELGTVMRPTDDRAAETATE